MCNNDTVEIEDRIRQLEPQPTLERTDYHYVTQWSTHTDSYIRDLVASMLSSFPSSETEQILIRLTKDPDVLVRTDAYDSLGSCPSNESLALLRTAMLIEPDPTARYYAICSCADVMYALAPTTVNDTDLFIQISTKDPSSLCRLGAFYARYILGEVNVLDSIISFLSCNDYHIRCATVAILAELTEDANKEYLTSVIEKHKLTESSEAVKSCMDSFAFS